MPIGNTDSEHAFCVLLEELRAQFPDYPRAPRVLWQAIARVAGRLAQNGTFNFLLGDGRHLYARCHTRLCYIIRKAPFGTAHLADDDVAVDFSSVTTLRDRVAVVATAPLTTNETWTHGKSGEMWVFGRGCLLANLPSSNAT